MNIWLSRILLFISRSFHHSISHKGATVLTLRLHGNHENSRIELDKQNVPCSLLFRSSVLFRLPHHLRHSSHPFLPDDRWSTFNGRLTLLPSCFTFLLFFESDNKNGCVNPVVAYDITGIPRHFNQPCRSILFFNVQNRIYTRGNDHARIWENLSDIHYLSPFHTLTRQFSQSPTRPAHLPCFFEIIFCLFFAIIHPKCVYSNLVSQCNFPKWINFAIVSYHTLNVCTHQHSQLHTPPIHPKMRSLFWICIGFCAFFISYAFISMQFASFKFDYLREVVPSEFTNWLW